MGGGSDDAVLLGPLYDFGDIAEGESGAGIGTAVVDGYAASLGIVERGTGEGHVGYIACELIDGLG